MNRTVLSLTLVISAAILSACEQKEAAKPAEPRPVLSMRVAEATSADAEFTGRVASRYTSDLGFEVSGRMTRRMVDVGDIVTAGQQLAEVDPLTFQFQVRIAEAQLQSATAQLENATQNEAREKKLLDQNISPKARYEAAQQARASAEASVTSARSALAKAREQLDNTMLSAPSAGVITDVKSQPGQTVQAGQAIVSLARPDVREAVVDVPERTARALAVGTAATVTSQVSPDVKVTGKVREIAPSLDAATRSVRIRIALEDPPPLLRLGTLVTVSFAAKAQPDLLVPETAILERDGKTFVWQIGDDGKVAPREVKATRQGNLRLVTEGLKAGEKIAIAGVHSLTEGQQVKISDEATQ